MKQYIYPSTEVSVLANENLLFSPSKGGGAGDPDKFPEQGNPGEI